MGADVHTCIYAQRVFESIEVSLGHGDKFSGLVHLNLHKLQGKKKLCLCFPVNLIFILRTCFSILKYVVGWCDFTCL